MGVVLPKAELLDLEGSAELVGALTGFSGPTIRNWADERLIPRPINGRFNLAEATKAIVSLRERVLLSESGADKVGEERAGYQRARREAVEMDLRVRKGELLEAEKIEPTLVSAVQAFKTRLLALPSKVAPRMPAVKVVADAKRIIEEEIEGALDELAKSATIAIAGRHAGQYPSDDRAGLLDSEAAAATDRKPMGRPRKDTLVGKLAGAR